jgi:hypothetical protein
VSFPFPKKSNGVTGLPRGAAFMGAVVALIGVVQKAAHGGGRDDQPDLMARCSFRASFL